VNEFSPVYAQHEKQSVLGWNVVDGTNAGFSRFHKTDAAFRAGQ
jgi:hypothetical protein